SQFVAQGNCDFIEPAAQSDFVVFAVVVGIRAREMPDSGLALDLHVALVTVNVEAGLGAILDAPDDDGGDFDGIAALVVDLEFVAVEVSGAQRNPQLSIEGIGPMKTAVA